MNDTGNGQNNNADKRETSKDFIRSKITEDIKSNKNNGKVITRFPPEPNGYLHIGHAKSICLNFGIAEEYEGGLCSLRFDDTNPLKESTEYVESIKSDVKWLGFDWKDRLFFASNYFDKLYEFAEKLITDGKAYICSLSADEIRQFRGTLKEPGKESPYRNRTIEENLNLFRSMKSRDFEDGTHVLRAKIDMSSPNLSMRDPALFRIRRAAHHRTGDKWCIYPMYDFAHCLSDAIEGVTHSLCTLEFENNRPLYNWVIENVEPECRPQQIEFARLNLTYTVLSKRRLSELVEGKFVSGWDDPRMPTLSGLKRRGYTPRAIRNFCDLIGIAKRDSMVDLALLEHTIREDLNDTAPRAMAVLNPLKVVITNYSEDITEEFDFPWHPQDSNMGSRKVPFSNILYIEQDDFMEDPPKKFFRLSPGKEVRLRYAYFIKCNEVIKDEKTGEVKELLCTYDPKTKGGSAPDGRKVKATLHWVSASHAIKIKVRLYDTLFTKENPMEEKEDDFKSTINPESLKILTESMVEPVLAAAEPGTRYQFERLGYFCVDSVDSTKEKPVFNRTVTLRDQWAKILKQKGQKKGG